MTDTRQTAAVTAADRPDPPPGGLDVTDLLPELDGPPRFLLTAAEAYPAFEEAVLDAKDEVLISMRVFDPDTPLYSPRAKRIGHSWSELIRRKLDQGVRFDITITDFDPVARADIHRYSWECLARLRAVAAASKQADRFAARVHMHPARVSFGHRLAFMFVSRGKLRTECDTLNHLDRRLRAERLALMPAFKALVRSRPGRVVPRLWPPAPLVPATHHQKMAVVDGNWLYIGGLDLNARRYDDTEHDRANDETWHDIQVAVTGPIAGVARDHILGFREWTNGGTPPPFNGLLRTLSCDCGQGHRGLCPQEVLHEIEDAHLRLIRNARRSIYIETQFLRSSTITDALVEAAGREPDLNLIVMLPAAPEDVAFGGSEDMDAKYGEQLQSEAVERLREAFGPRAFFGAPAQPRTHSSNGRDTHFDAPIIYIHAKCLVVDETAAIVSSANLNGRSMRWDTETGLVFAGADAAQLFDRCARHWFPKGPPDAPGQARAWHDAASGNADLTPEDRPHFVLPYSVTPARETGQNIPGMPEEMV
ncbi:phospholipase D-like domain-containing protein [Maritimibacter sp. DP1N21-5]|uniref:phospholipase D-like domain-containing protein n=1 Tax=Maritimibacter sp. DP1N21-5 TaxID=2836867 RepID=UPI001C468248|nr:phospholipase D-like domain-containing protein [Maritimibacter sp. DP1N21-5]MBV7410395.1 phospholipase [Maritimibacter sp. DP1N21-5]